MPMDMSIPLLASQRQDVDALGIDRLSHRFAYGIDSALQRKILVQCEITGHLFLMCGRRDKNVAIQRGIFVEKDDELIVLVHDVVTIQPARDHLANETWTVLDALDIGILVKRFTLAHGVFSLAGGVSQELDQCDVFLMKPKMLVKPQRARVPGSGG